MKRRAFIALASVAAPVVARAQKAPPTVGFMYSGAAGSPAATRVIGLIKQGLTENGLTEGRDYRLEIRFADGDYQRFPAMARELAQAGARVILASTVPSVRAAQALDPPVPVVITLVLDPLGNGLIDSLARPGRNTTGVALLNADLSLKLLELQRTVLPKAQVVAALYNPASPANAVALGKLQSQAGTLGLTVLPAALKSPDELDSVFSMLAERTPDTLQIVQDAGTLDMAGRITALALKHRLPTFAETSLIPRNGGLLSYGPQTQALLLRTGYYVARILGGTKPADLPVEQPSLFELVINLRTAKVLGLDIPPTLLAQADTVIE
ncbi:MAG: ABC transporter substrate-binding protein [Reyranella sp.]|nr:ABC transporter substrate-binding protein [Reyranella sp.]